MAANAFLDHFHPLDRSRITNAFLLPLRAAHAAGQRLSPREVVAEVRRQALEWAGSPHPRAVGDQCLTALAEHEGEALAYAVERAAYCALSPEDRGGWRGNPTTGAQRWKLRSLGIAEEAIPPLCGAASALITEILEGKQEVLP